MKLSLSGKLQTVLSTMRYKMAYSDFAGKIRRRFTITSEQFLLNLEAWVHGGPEPVRRIACLIQNIPICSLNAHRKSTRATYFILEVTAKTSAKSTDYKVREVIVSHCPESAELQKLPESSWCFLRLPTPSTVFPTVQ
jgi:hypothetical protein